MLDQVISALAAWIVAVISAAGYLGVVALMAIESACIPLPSEVIMPFAGYLVSIGRFSLVAAATAGALGCNVGSTIAYVVALKGGRRAFERWGAYVLVSSAELDRAEQFFARYGGVTVFVGRLLPVVRTFIAFP
ncbi:MAG TPA: DedA family protein, partial [Xanthobacteraceae bacterium]|nr:DedA family protein [Xanthobacteraceae bacterium]